MMKFAFPKHDFDPKEYRWDDVGKTIMTEWCTSCVGCSVIPEPEVYCHDLIIEKIVGGELWHRKLEIEMRDDGKKGNFSNVWSGVFDTVNYPLRRIYNPCSVSDSDLTFSLCQDILFGDDRRLYFVKTDHARDVFAWYKKTGEGVWHPRPINMNGEPDSMLKIPRHHYWWAIIPRSVHRQWLKNNPPESFKIEE